LLIGFEAILHLVWVEKVLQVMMLITIPSLLIMKVGPQVLLKYGSDPSLKAVEALGFEPAWWFNLMHLSLLIIDEHAWILKSHASGNFVKGLEEEVGVFYELEGDRDGVKVLV
jgi:hypothetical protein